MNRFTGRVAAVVLAVVAAGGALQGPAHASEPEGGVAPSAALEDGSLFVYDGRLGRGSLVGVDDDYRVGMSGQYSTTYSAGYTDVSAGEFLPEGRGSGVLLYDADEGRYAVLENRGPGVRPATLAYGRVSAGYEHVELLRSGTTTYAVLLRPSTSAAETYWSLLRLDGATGRPSFVSTGRLPGILVDAGALRDGSLFVTSYTVDSDDWQRWALTGTGSSARLVVAARGLVDRTWDRVTVAETDGAAATSEVVLSQRDTFDRVRWAVVQPAGTGLTQLGTGTFPLQVDRRYRLHALGTADDGDVTPLFWQSEGVWSGRANGRGVRVAAPGSLATTVRSSLGPYSATASTWVVHPAG